MTSVWARSFGPHSSPATGKEFEEDGEAYEAACPGKFEQPESAQSGVLCIYVGPETGTPLNGPLTAESGPAYTFGIALTFQNTYGKAAGTRIGSWALMG